MMPMSGCPAKRAEGSVELGERETLTHFTFEAVELRPATVCNVLPRVEQADPEAGGPGVLELGLRPGPPGGHLVGGNELLGLRDGSRSPGSPVAAHTAAARPTMDVSGWAITLSQSCTASGASDAQAMFWDSQSP
jgi:hypothetical protein